ncbi:uncharacterized protein [Littorina saxatilis]|uniref:uncharacterized protein n=1 Tax=Littorina saxatilis TaxID=31220 RepID=UPI0038B6A452
MMAALLQTLLITVALTALSIGIEMTGCGENSPLEMVENSQNYNVTCTNIGGTDWSVKWERARGRGAGTCVAPNSCTSTTRPLAVVSRPTYSTTTMTVKITDRRFFANQVVTCYTETPTNPPVRRNEDSCVVDVVVPAVLSAGSVEVDKTSPSWTVRANTTITTVFSSEGRYSCLWYTEPQARVTYDILLQNVRKNCVSGYK